MNPWKNYAQRLSRDLRFKHFIGGIVYRDPASPFDRPARITVFFCYVNLNFTATALFFGKENFNLGQTIIVGVLGALILLPASGIFNQLFIRVGKAVANYKKRQEREQKRIMKKRKKMEKGMSGGGKSRKVMPEGVDEHESPRESSSSGKRSAKTSARVQPVPPPGKKETPNCSNTAKLRTLLSLLPLPIRRETHFRAWIGFRVASR